jgi:hypothetical protein
MSEQKNRGQKIKCPKCGSLYYDLSRKHAPCPSCHRASLIEDGTVAEVSLRIKRGGYNEPDQGWTDECATANKNGAAWLDCEFEIIVGELAGKKFRSLIGLHTPKGPWWGNEGRRTIRNILNSAHSLLNEDYSHEATSARRLKSLAELDGLTFLAEIGVRKGKDGLEANELSAALTPDDECFSSTKRASETDSVSNGRDDMTGKSSPKLSENTAYTPVWMSKV